MSARGRIVASHAKFARTTIPRLPSIVAKLRELSMHSGTVQKDRNSDLVDPYPLASYYP